MGPLLYSRGEQYIMKMYGHMDMNENKLQRAALEVETQFPPNAEVGRIVFTNKRVYICVEITGGQQVWIPLSSKIDTYTWYQQTAASTWTITHNLNTTSPIVQLYGSDNTMMLPDSVEPTDNNTVVVHFGTAAVGRAVIMFGNLVGGSPNEIRMYEHTQTTVSTTWTINHNLGGYPAVRVFVGNQEILPESITHVSNNQTVITFSTAVMGIAKLVL